MALQFALRSGRYPLLTLRAHFRALAEFYSNTGYVRGCLIGNLALELSGKNDALRSRLEEVFSQWENIVESRLSAIMPNALNSERRGAAAALIEAFEGAVMRAKVIRNHAPFERFEKFVLSRMIT